MKTIGIDISVLADKQRTGIGNYTYELTCALLKENKKDKFILFGIVPLESYSTLKNLKFKNYPNVEMKIYKFPKYLFRRTFLLWQKLNWPEIETFIGPVDLFHSFNWFMPPQKKGKKVATIFDLTSIMFPDLHDSKTTQLDKIRFQKIAKFADLAIAISENTKNDFLKFHPKGQVEVVYPAASDNFNSTVDRKLTQKVLNKYHMQPGFYLSVATLEPRKNLKTLIDSYNKGNFQEPLVLVGKMGWGDNELSSSIKNNSKIQHTGYIPDEDLKVLFQQALCLVYPSFYEGFGIPVLEALSCGTPVITSDTSSLPEVGGDAVLYVNPNKVESIVKALKTITSDSKLRTQLVTKGLQQAKKFSWQKSAQKLNNLYQEIMA